MEIVPDSALEQFVELVAGEVLACSREDVLDVEWPVHRVAWVDVEDLVGEGVLVVEVEALEEFGIEVIVHEL